jgi:hypothetical protein
LTNDPVFPLIVMDVGVPPVYVPKYCGAGMLVYTKEGPVAPFGSY